MDRGLLAYLILFVALPLILLAVALTAWSGNIFAVMGAIFLFGLGVVLHPMFVPEPS